MDEDDLKSYRTLLANSDDHEHGLLAHRLSTTDRMAFTGAVDLAAITLAADTDLSLAACAAKYPTFFDHPAPEPVTVFWTRAGQPSDVPQRNIARSPR